MGQVKNNANVGRDHLNPVIDEMRQVQTESILRHIHALNITGTQLAQLTGSIRPNEVTDLKLGETRNFGIGRLATACIKLDITQYFRCFRPLESFRRTKLPDPRMHALFAELYRVHDLCEAVTPEIGERTYPTTAAVLEHVSKLSLHLVESISREPHFWQREAFAVSSIYLAAEQLLKRLQKKSRNVDQLLFQLAATAEFMEEIADDLIAAETRKAA
jgi:hypothetical protein